MPKVTVLMPVYNASAYLHDAIQSILNQTFQDFEFLIIDDGSSDNSEIIIKGYKDKRIRFIKNEQNIGISATLNKGIELASCELIARMDADDVSYPKRLEKQYN
ncbi:MAG: glycosyltransferase family 2 protein, partial [Nitrosopumilus sp.]|nr:glycosyltransferase family 2 protein [Nitrosopumilus sp.]